MHFELDSGVRLDREGRLDNDRQEVALDVVARGSDSSASERTELAEDDCESEKDVQLGDMRRLRGIISKMDGCTPSGTVSGYHICVAYALPYLDVVLCLLLRGRLRTAEESPG